MRPVVVLRLSDDKNGNTAILLSFRRLVVEDGMLEDGGEKSHPRSIRITNGCKDSPLVTPWHRPEQGNVRESLKHFDGSSIERKARLPGK
jgi:hypothetical protein